jgi:16S rRNA (uracil1498-N3)-methyltransferase
MGGNNHMTRRRFYAPPSQIAIDQSKIELSIEESKHLREVLRLKTGDNIFVFDGEGNEYLCTIEDVGRKDKPALLKLIETAEPACPESHLELTLAIGLLKGDKFDFVIQKITELGSSRIIPVITARTDVRLRNEEDGLRRKTRWNRIALEAAKQSGRAGIPLIDSPLDFSSVIDKTPIPTDNTLHLIFTERNGGKLNKIVNNSITALIAMIGPEGGWEDKEIQQAINAGWKTITFGGRILRAETAAVVVTGLLQYQFGDMG